MKALGDFFLGEWYFSVPMTLMTITAFALVFWRWLLNANSNTNLETLLPDVQENLRRKGTKAALALCKEEKGLIPNTLFVAGLEASEQGVAAMRRSMAGAVELEILPRLNFLLAPILAIAKISTMVGLLGTVISMINTFTKIADPKAGAEGITGQAGSIGLALFATALGLLTAIPLVFAHVLFKAWIVKFEIKMKIATQKLITLVVTAKNAPPTEAEDDDREEDDETDAKTRELRKGSRR
jgi:biopolymer transport protein ExbB